MKKAQVIWSSEALVDLEIIYDFIAEKSEQEAKQIIEDILSRTRQIEAFPESGARQETFKDTGREYRYLVEGNYKIIYSYRADQQAVFIEIVFDTRQDPAKMKD